MISIYIRVGAGWSFAGVVDGTKCCTAISLHLVLLHRRHVMEFILLYSSIIYNRSPSI